MVSLSHTLASLSDDEMMALVGPAAWAICHARRLMSEMISGWCIVAFAPSQFKIVLVFQGI